MNKILVIAFAMATFVFASHPVRAADAESDSADEITLEVGSPAAPIDIENWIHTRDGQFKPVTQFEPGNVYVIEFWATWCGPCIQNIPHLAKLQDKYADDGVQIISITDEEPDTVTEFLKGNVPTSFFESENGSESADGDTEKAKSVTYDEVASKFCLVTDPDDSVFDAYMAASGNRTIPTAFLVGKSGVIEWIGRADDLDMPLARVVANQWDRTMWNKALVLEADIDTLFGEFSSLTKMEDYQTALSLLETTKEERAYLPEYADYFRSMQLLASIGVKDVDRAKELFPELKEELQGEDPYLFDAVGLIDFAKEMFRAASDGDTVDPELGAIAVFVAEKAVAIMEQVGTSKIEDGGRSLNFYPAEPLVLATAMQDTALMMSKIGKSTDAIAMQKRAIEVAPDESKQSFETTLREIKELKVATSAN